MKKIMYIVLLASLGGCVSLSYQEKEQINQLKSQGITVDSALGSYERPASVAGAGLLNLLPGFGNFYLGNGDAPDSMQNLYGVLNLLVWPISIVWAVPQAAVDANTINKRELVRYYLYDKSGKEALRRAGAVLE